MSMETALRARLKADTAVTAITQEIHWNAKPQKAPYPAAVLLVVFDGRSQNMSGFDGYRETRVQIDCFAETKPDAVALREAVIAAITPAATQSGVSFLRAQQITVVDRGTNTEVGFIYRELIEASIWHDA